MIRLLQSFPRLFTKSIVLLLSYLTLVSPFAPILLYRAEAAAARTKFNQINNSVPMHQEIKRGYEPAELIVRFRENVREDEKRLLIESRGWKRVRSFYAQPRTELIKLSTGHDVETTINELRFNHLVELVEANYHLTVDQIVSPNDPRYSEQWALKNNGAEGRAQGFDIGAEQAWQKTTGDKSTLIAVVDTGIDFNHADLKSNQWVNGSEQIDGRDNDDNRLTDDVVGWDFVNNSGVIKDQHGHGTAMAGIIAAQGNNRLGTTGVMWNAGLMSLRAFDTNGKGTIANVVQAIDYAIEHGAKVIVCAWGTEEKSLLLKEVLERADRYGVVIVCSAGNNGNDIDNNPYYPGSFSLKNVITVAGNDGYDTLPSWSNWGVNSVDVAAPGVDILTTKAGGGYQTITGTSASTAIVGGIAGLIKTERGWLSAAGTAAAIKEGVRKLGALEGKVKTGGSVSASGAFSAMRTPSSTTLEAGNSTSKESAEAEASANKVVNNEDHKVDKAIAIPTIKGAENLPKAADFMNKGASSPSASMLGDLPNLDAIKTGKPATPKIRPGVPSNHKYNWPGEDLMKSMTSRPTPTTSPEPVSVPKPKVTPTPSPKPKAKATPTPAPKPKVTRVGPLKDRISPLYNPNDRPSYPMVAANTNSSLPTTYDIPTLLDNWYRADGSGYVAGIPSLGMKKDLNIPADIKLANSASMLSSSSMATSEDEGFDDPIYYGGYISAACYNISGRVQLNKDYWDYWNRNFPYSYRRDSINTIEILAYERDHTFWPPYPYQGYNVFSGFRFYSWIGTAYVDSQGNFSGSHLYYNNISDGREYHIAVIESYEEYEYNSDLSSYEWVTKRFIWMDGSNGTISSCGRWGTITANPNPIQVCDPSGYGIANITWDSANAQNVEVRVNAPDGTLFASSGPGQTSSQTGKWVANGTTFYLQDVSYGRPLTSEHTLATTTVGVNTNGCPAPDFSSPRLLPENETGDPGVNPASKNVNWSMPLVSLPGRAGLDLNLSLTYNSLVWTKSSTGWDIMYDADHGMPSPGFRFGLPIIQPSFYNSRNIITYILIDSSGGRKELSHVGGLEYVSMDGDYTQMILNDNGGATVRTKDGTQLLFSPSVNGEMRCTQIKDRNGNYLSFTYNGAGNITSAVDTLGRTITFNYDGNNRLLSVTQNRGGNTYTWATFVYSDVYMAPDFGNMRIHGPKNQNVSLLTQVNLPDGSYYKFDYTSFGQIWAFRHFAADNHQRSYTSYNLPTTSQTDCPRFNQETVWAENWNGGSAVTTTYNSDPNGGWSEVRLPDGTVHKQLYATTGWQKGLTTSSEVWVGGVRKKWTTQEWTQDDNSLTYQKNPRVTETNVYDSDGNRRRTTISYTSYSLPNEIKEYASDGTTLLKTTQIDYILYNPYLEARLIGLPLAQRVYDGNGQLLSKVSYGYDWKDNYFVAQGPSIQHDSTNYSSTYVTGRGNLSAILRWDVTTPDDGNKAVWQSLIGYNMAGSRVWMSDGAGRRVDYTYSDSFSDGNNTRNTLAYVTELKDGDRYSTTTQYNYDTGATTRTQDPKGAVGTVTYDAIGRIERITNVTSGAYTRYVYPTSQNYVQSYSLIDTGVEIPSTSVFDGMGRVRAVSGKHPGSTGGYMGQLFVYDVMGRMTQSSNPAEITSSWTLTGDDASTEWKWTRQEYDWQSRPTITTNVDGTTTEATYGGCGCAGGVVTTIRDERGRKRRLTSDTLGRLIKVEEFKLDGTVYATTNYSYNGRDQLVNINQSGQLRTMEYDGHGRLSAMTTPEQGRRTYTYYANDVLHRFTDARGATATYNYNGRGLVTGITYTVPAGVAPTADVSFGYDEAGNRTAMVDGQGRVDYTYNTLSQLTQESRQFSGLGQTYTLSYGYNVGGMLTRITNSWGGVVNYAYDGAGRVSAVTGSGHQSAPSYIQGIQYRAFGAIKGITYGNGRSLSANYDNRMRITQYNIPGVMGANYGYNDLGENGSRVTYAQSLYDATLDRSYEYDHVGRLTKSFTGSSARAFLGKPGGQWVADGPYAQNQINYDVWGNMTEINGWGGSITNMSLSYTNNRMDRNPINGIQMQYDAAGNITNDGLQTYTYDATGQQVTASMTGLQQAYDGGRLRVKKIENGVATYYFRSTMLGGKVIAEINGSGGWKRGYVYLGGTEVAVSDGEVLWNHYDGITKSKRMTDGGGAVVSAIEVDPWGGETSRSVNSSKQPKRYTSYERDADGGDEAMHRRYSSYWKRFMQPDPYEGSMDMSNPQSMNRYAYVENDPVNRIDPSGLDDGILDEVWIEAGEWSDWLYAGNSGGLGGGFITPVGGGNADTGGGGAGSGGGGAGGGPTNEPPYPGGSPNPYAQLAPCPELTVPTFEQLTDKNGLNLLNNTYGQGAKAAYEGMTTYEKAVFVNTSAAAISVGVNLSSAKFEKFYRSDKPGNLPYGMYVSGASGKTEGRHANLGSVELDTKGGVTQMDVDLYKGGLFSKVLGKHLDEVEFNNKHNRPTHPGDVARQLATRNVHSGVACK
jgi:RHS repeat-associated protein